MDEGAWILEVSYTRDSHHRQVFDDAFLKDMATASGARFSQGGAGIEHFVGVSYRPEVA